MFLYGDLLIARAIQSEILEQASRPDTALLESASRSDPEPRSRPSDRQSVCPTCQQPIRAAS